MPSIVRADGVAATVAAITLEMRLAPSWPSDESAVQGCFAARRILMPLRVKGSARGTYRSHASSRNSTPRSARHSAPGRICPDLPPPRRHGRRVVRRLERRADHQGGVRRQGARHRVDGGDLEYSVLVEGRQEPGQALGEHVFPAPEGPARNRWCPPAAATLTARRPTAWPTTSLRSGPRRRLGEAPSHVRLHPRSPGEVGQQLAERSHGPGPRRPRRAPPRRRCRPQRRPAGGSSAGPPKPRAAPRGSPAPCRRVPVRARAPGRRPRPRAPRPPPRGHPRPAPGQVMVRTRLDGDGAFG